MAESDLVNLSGGGSNQGNNKNEKSFYHQVTIDFRCYLELARSEPRLAGEGSVRGVTFPVSVEQDYLVVEV